MAIESLGQSDPFRPGATPEGRYTIHRQIGRGGFGGVYLDSQPDKTQLYALKRLLPEHQVRVATRQLFQREAETWIRLPRSPYVVRAHWVDRVQSELCLVLECIPGDFQDRATLRDYLSVGAPPTTLQRLTWAVHCCRGMEAAFSSGIRAHRDLKPSNVLIDPRAIARITDFGIALLARPVAEASVGFAGTLPYMAPETFTRPESAGAQSDLYSFGVMLFEMMTGRRPFSAGSAQADAWLRAHLESQIPSTNFPGGDIVRRCLAKRPEDRPRSFAEVGDDLDAIREIMGAPPVTHPTESETSASDWNNRAMSLMMLNQTEEALACMERALELDPGFAKAWSNMGSMLSKRKKTAEEALRCLSRATELDPSLALPWMGVGFVHVNSGRFAAALQAYDRAVALDPSYLPTRHDRARCLLELGRVEDAVLAFEEIVAADPEWPQAWQSLADAYAKQGEFDPRSKRTARLFAGCRMRIWNARLVSYYSGSGGDSRPRRL